jgi:hypothetical protein
MRQRDTSRSRERVPQRYRILDKDRAFPDVLPLERERLTRTKSGVGQDADQGRIP